MIGRAPQLAVDDHIFNIFPLDHQLVDLLGFLHLLSHLIQGPSHTLSSKANKSCILEPLIAHPSYFVDTLVQFIKEKRILSVLNHRSIFSRVLGACRSSRHRCRIIYAICGGS